VLRSSLSTCPTSTLRSEPQRAQATEHIVALLIAERDKRNRAIEALQGSAKAAWSSSKKSAIHPRGSGCYPTQETFDVCGHEKEHGGGAKEAMGYDERSKEEVTALHFNRVIECPQSTLTLPDRTITVSHSWT
jgi:hypothetical protein